MRFSLILAGTAFCALLVSCGSKTETPPPAPAPQTNAAPSAAAVSPELTKLVGTWERPDGGYVLEIKSVDASGKLEHNPQSDQLFGQYYQAALQQTYEVVFVRAK